jgi:hypothetical protein
MNLTTSFAREAAVGEGIVDLQHERRRRWLRLEINRLRMLVSIRALDGIDADLRIAHLQDEEAALEGKGTSEQCRVPVSAGRVRILDRVSKALGRDGVNEPRIRRNSHQGAACHSPEGTISMNPMQRRAAAEAAFGIPAPTGAGHWISGTSLTIGQVRFPRGCVLSDEAVASIPAERMDILRANRLLLWRRGPAPANAPAAVPIVPEDAAAIRTAQRAAMVRDGYQPFEIDVAEKAPPGAYLATHPSAAAKPSRLPISAGFIDDK